MAICRFDGWPVGRFRPGFSISALFGGLVLQGTKKRAKARFSDI
jgi:hypothetical protein